MFVEQELSAVLALAGSGFREIERLAVYLVDAVHREERSPELSFVVEVIYDAVLVRGTDQFVFDLFWLDLDGTSAGSIGNMPRVA